MGPMAILTSRKIRFTVREYLRMSEAGVFDDRRVEMLDGRILQMHARSNAHMAAVTRINILLNRHFSDVKKYWLVVQGTYTIEPADAPDPDFHIFAAPVGTPDADLPRPFLVIEVAQSSYRRDSGIKLRRYAAAGVADYWIVNIAEKRVEVYRGSENPTGRKRDWRYGSVQQFGIDQKVKLLARPEIELPVGEMLVSVWDCARELLLPNPKPDEMLSPFFCETRIARFDDPAARAVRTELESERPCRFPAEDVFDRVHEDLCHVRRRVSAKAQSPHAAPGPNDLAAGDFKSALKVPAAAVIE